MKESDYEELFVHLKQTVPDEARKRQAIQTLMREARRQNYVRRPSFVSRLLVQLQYLSRAMIVLQALFVVAGLLCLGFVAADVPYEKSGLAAVMLLPLFGILLAAVDMAEISKSSKYQMWELEAVCANSVREVMLQRCLLLNGFGVGFMFCLACLASWSLRQDLLFLLNGLCSPFLLLCAIYLKCLDRFSGRLHEGLLLGVSIVVGGFVILVLGYMQLYAAGSVLFAAGMLLFSVLLFLYAFYQCFCMEKEGSVWN